MKTKEEVIKESNTGDYKFDGLLQELTLLAVYAQKIGYGFGVKDIMAIGYMCGKYDVKSLFDEADLRRGIDEYDKTDELHLFDTIAECFMDMLDYKPS